MIALRRRTAGVIVAACALGLTGCAPATDPTHGWDEPANYTATVEYSAYDTTAGTYEIVVRDHVPVEFTRVDHRGFISSIDESDHAMNFTLRQIVGRFQAALADRTSAETLTWDTAHLPSEVSIDWYPEQTTDEQHWIITDIEVQIF